MDNMLSIFINHWNVNSFVFVLQMSELANILQTVNIPQLVIQLGVRELGKRES